MIGHAVVCKLDCEQLCPFARSVLTSDDALMRLRCPSMPSANLQLAILQGGHTQLNSTQQGHIAIYASRVQRQKLHL